MADLYKIKLLEWKESYTPPVDIKTHPLKETAETINGWFEISHNKIEWCWYLHFENDRGDSFLGKADNIKAIKRLAHQEHVKLLKQFIEFHCHEKPKSDDIDFLKKWEEISNDMPKTPKI